MKHVKEVMDPGQENHTNIKKRTQSQRMGRMGVLQREASGEQEDWSATGRRNPIVTSLFLCSRNICKKSTVEGKELISEKYKTTQQG